MAILSPIGSDGEARRDAALSKLRAFRPVLVRRIQRAYLQFLLQHGPHTSDAARSLVPIPVGIDPRVVGAAVRGLAEVHLIVPTGERRKSHRPEAHARTLEVWTVRDQAAALAWLESHPELPEPELN